jgi:hypothetical protein
MFCIDFQFLQNTKIFALTVHSIASPILLENIETIENKIVKLDESDNVFKTNDEHTITSNIAKDYKPSKKDFDSNHFVNDERRKLLNVRFMLINHHYRNSKTALTIGSFSTKEQRNSERTLSMMMSHTEDLDFGEFQRTNPSGKL